MAICKPDELCNAKKIKNPVNYAFKAMMRAKRLREGEETKHKSVKAKRIKRANK
jgi:hypothetical protein